MRTSAVICEFNPIHLGHKYILSKARESAGDDGCVIAVMSGNFCERCTPAVYDKYTRAHSAVLCGADIVLELPFPWCSSGVEDFALGGVYIAASLGADTLTFGSESGNAEMIKTCADIKQSEEFIKVLRELESRERQTGSAVLYSRAMAEFGIDSTLGANDKLGTEYMICGRKYGIGGYNVVRRDMSCKSAGEIRGMMFGGCDGAMDNIPDEARAVFENARFCDEERYNDILFGYARLMRETCSPELTYAKNTAENASSAEEFIKNLPQKKLTLARMRRELLFSLMGVERMNKKSPPSFTVLLAANERGREYFRGIKKKLSMSIVTKPADIPKSCGEEYRLNQDADKLYTLCAGERADLFMLKKPIIL